jgi:predicted ATPase/class 3 adenylate cyclase
MDVQLGARSGPKPTGTVTFLFSDVEGSTQRWERDRSGMEAAVRLHDGLMRSAIVDHHGHVFKTIGDEFCAVFARPDDAVAAALDAQRALLAADFGSVGELPVRMALHTGTSEERDDDYFGPTVNRVARLLAIGNGGQVLVSGVTTDLVQGTMPEQAALRDLGAHRLRDLTYPEQVYQLVAPGLRSDFPALRSLEELPNNLPLQLTSFVGREHEIAEIESYLRRHRVVTIVGSGGVGKTRTSLQVGANMLDGLGDGVWFVELAPLADGSMITSAIASALGIELSAGASIDTLVAVLKAKSLLLILDNCEHLVEPAARVVDALVRGCPKITVLASSRQGLGIAGEATYRMPSLSLPDAAVTAGLTPSELRRFGAIALFVERAEAADQHFLLSAENAGAVADICRRLDGIAFAIELAAARVRMLTPQQLQRRLDERFRVLTGGSRTALPRQQTLRALIDWSHELLDLRERTLFRRVGIFVDGFSIEAAGAVCTDAAFDEFELFDVLASLVDKSLITTELSGAATRYRLLESTRAYALEKLTEAAETTLLAERHLRHYEELASRSLEAFQAFAVDPFEWVGGDLENFRAAIAYALGNGHPLSAAQLAIAAYGADVSPSDEIVNWLERSLEEVQPGHTVLRARLTTLIAAMLSNAGRTDRAREAMGPALIGAREAGDPATLFESLLQASSMTRRFPRQLDDAAAYIEEAQELLAAIETPRRRYQFLRERALALGARGDVASAIRDFTAIEDLCRAFSNESVLRSAALNSAEFEHEAGNTARAIEIALSGLPFARRRSTDTHVNHLVNLAAYCFAAGSFVDGTSYLTAMLDIARSNPLPRIMVGIAIEQAALILALRGDRRRSRRLAAFASAEFDDIGFEREYTERVTKELLETALDGVEADDDANGAKLSGETAVALAIEALAATAPAEAAQPA